MTTSDVVKAIVDNYSLGDLEERLEATTLDLLEGLDCYVEQNYDKVLEMLREDLFF